LLAGYDQIGNVITKVYRNNSGVFYDIGAVITGVYVGSAIWGDYDNDGRLDILVSGCTQWMCPAVATKLYHNSGGMVNTPPDEPTGLVSEIKGNTVTLSWQPTTDGESQSVGLTYNVRVGTTPSGTQVQAPMADTNTGHRRIVALGSSGHALTTTLRNIMPGVRYYWSVQAVDSSFTGSAFASERSFGTVVSPDQIRITGPANGTVNIPYRFVATIGPTNTTLPLTYTWQISGKSVVSTVSGITNAVNISWSTTGVHGITATVANEGGEVVDTSAIIVSGEPHYVYMPIVTIAAPHRLFLPYFVHRWPPVPYTPILNEISNPSGFGTYTVNWSTAQLADGYVLQEDDNSTFSSPDEVYRGAATSWVTPIPRQAGTYYYRVNAYNSWGSSEFSNANATTVFLPEAPVLSPINNSDQKNTYVLNWTPSMRATAYHVQEDSRADFSSPRAVYTGTSTTWTITDKTPGTYYYRVIAGGPTGTSEWSNTQSRTIYPFFVGLSLRWDGEGYIRIDEYYDVGTHVTRNCDAMTDADTIRCVNSQWYDPDPKGWGRENWNAYYSLSTGNWRANSVPSDPAWKWSEPYVLPYDWYLYNGQELAISGKIFLVSGPYEGITAFGKRVSYWRLVNRDRFLYVDSGSQWTQYVHPGDIVLHYDAGSTRLLLYRNTLRRYYYNGSLTSYTVQYIQQLTSANSFPGANVLNRVVADRDISSADFGNRNKTQDVDSTRILGQESGEGQDERRVYRGDQQRIDSHDEARDHMLE
jgi:hypothetical protein